MLGITIYRVTRSTYPTALLYKQHAKINYAMILCAMSGEKRKGKTKTKKRKKKEKIIPGSVHQASLYWDPTPSTWTPEQPNGKEVLPRGAATALESRRRDHTNFG